MSPPRHHTPDRVDLAVQETVAAHADELRAYVALFRAWGNATAEQHAEYSRAKGAHAEARERLRRALADEI